MKVRRVVIIMEHSDNDPKKIRYVRHTDLSWNLVNLPLHLKHRILLDKIHQIPGIFIEPRAGEVVFGQKVVGDGRIVSLRNEKVWHAVSGQTR